jgi:hypothetical protein
VPIAANIGDDHRATVVVGSISVPAGRFAITSTIVGFNNDSDTQVWSCFFDGSAVGGRAAMNSFFSDGLGEKETVALASTITLAAPGTVTVSCNGFKLAVEGYFSAMAIQ